MSNKLYAKVFGWMFIGLLVTFGTGLVLMNYPDGVVNLFGGMGYLIMLIVEVGIAIFFSVRLKKMSKTTAVFCFLLYSFLTGVTFSLLFLEFKLDTLLYVFLATSLVFGLFAFFGSVTKLPLHKMGTFLLVALFAIIILELINIFIGSEQLDMGLCIIGVLVFVGYTAYDVKRLPMLLDYAGEENGAIYGAFQLYLDFINLFLRLLELFGNNNYD